LPSTVVEPRVWRLGLRFSFGASAASHARPKFLIGPSEGLGAEQATGGCSAAYNFDPVQGDHPRDQRLFGS
jgi:hypothetical protein